MEELTKRNGKGVRMREIENALKRFGASIEWLTERMGQRDGEMDSIRETREMEEREKGPGFRAMKAKHVVEVLDEVEVLIDVHFYNELSGTVFNDSEVYHHEPEYA